MAQYYAECQFESTKGFHVEAENEEEARAEAIDEMVSHLEHMYGFEGTSEMILVRHIGEETENN